MKSTYGLSAESHERLTAIARAHNATLVELRGVARFRNLVAARAECYRYLRDKGWSLPQIGGLFNRDHTSVLYHLDPGIRTKKGERARDPFAKPMGAKTL